MVTYKRMILAGPTFLLAVVLAIGPTCTIRPDARGQSDNTRAEKASPTPNEILEGSKRMVTANKINNPDPEAAPSTKVSFESKVTPGQDALIVSYTVANNSDKDIYLLDAYPAVNENRQAFADLKGFFLSFREPSTAFVLKGVPPLPSRPVTVRVMPLGTKIGPNSRVTREFKIPMPLRERSDWYYPPSPPEDYTMGSVDKLSLRVQFIRSGVEGFDAKPAHYAAEYAIVTATEMVKNVETLKAEHGIPKSQLFIRKDQFPRF
jgi:hypothetical protein